MGCPGLCYGCHVLPTLPLGDLAVAMRGERRALPWGEFLGVVLRLAARRRRLFPSFLGVLRMLNASDCRRWACGGGEMRELGAARGGSQHPSLFLPSAHLLAGGQLLAPTDLGAASLATLPGGLGPREAAGWLLGLEEREQIGMVVAGDKSPGRGHCPPGS